MMHKLLIKLTAGALLAVCAIAARAQSTPPIPPGEWLTNSIAAHERIKTSAKYDANDFNDSYALVGFVSGFVAAHRQNNFMYVILFAASEKMPKEKRLEMMRTAGVFTPLRHVPDAASNEQLIAALKNYLAANPGKWNQSAPLLMTDALKEAFPAPAR